jgi:hypothetical protein
MFDGWRIGGKSALKMPQLADRRHKGWAWHPRERWRPPDYPSPPPFRTWRLFSSFRSLEIISSPANVTRHMALISTHLTDLTAPCLNLRTLTPLIHTAAGSWCSALTSMEPTSVLVPRPATALPAMGIVCCARYMHLVQLAPARLSVSSTSTVQADCFSRGGPRTNSNRWRLEVWLVRS